MVMKQLVRPQAVIPRLYALAPEPLPFAPSLEIRAFLIQRPSGNLLVYSTLTVADEVEAIAELGGVARHYLNHRHEAMFGPERVAAAFGAPLFVHRNERAAVEEHAHVRGAFSKRHTLGDDLEVIPTPGHTGGATAFLWDSGRHRVLFTGDTLYLDAGEWVAAVLKSSDRTAYLESLELISELEFDVLVPWAASSGEPFYAVTSRADARRRIGAVIERLRRGESR
jgi:glyoxylase-like metal-dependent hydrolase (beta-lactamase superfamily II)